MANPFPVIVNTVGTLSAGHIVLATEWNTAVGGIYTYINNTLLAAGLNKAAAKGDIYAFDGTNLQVLAVGTNDQVLTADSGQATGLKWAPATATPLNTKGDTLYYDSGALQRLAVGTANQLLTIVAGLPAWSSNVPTGVVPVGGVILWPGSQASIPSNYQLCDGTNGTPNMQGLFPIGAGANSPPATAGFGNLAVGATGGSTTHVHSIPAINYISPAPVNTYISPAYQTGSASTAPSYYAIHFIQRMS